jgi:hypothetical protein
VKILELSPRMTGVLLVVWLTVVGPTLSPSVAQDVPKNDGNKDPVTDGPVTDGPTEAAGKPTEESTTEQSLAVEAARRDREADLLKQYGNFLDEPTKANGFTRLSASEEVWIHLKKKTVMAGGYVCLRQGALEMFACPSRTKEHESVLGVRAKAELVHAALLAVGAKVGKPVQYQPDYQPASGTVINLYILWKDADGRPRADRAQEWIREWKSKQAMQENWVFAGSEFWKDPGTGEQHYSANSGELVCVSNFSTATMDVPVESSQSDAALLYEAFTERLPPLRTEIRLLFVPEPAKAKPDQEPKPVDAKQPAKDAQPAKSSSEDVNDSLPRKRDSSLTNAEDDQ